MALVNQSESSQSTTASLSLSVSENSPPGPGSLSSCRYCKGINLQSLSQSGGYKHATHRSSLVRTARKCKFCSLLFRKDRSKIKNEPLYLSLYKSEEDDPLQVFLRVSHGQPDEDPDHQDLMFSLYTSSGDPAEEYGISAKRPLTNTASSKSFETAVSWIEDCLSNHICSKKLPLKDSEHDFQTWPARLLDLEAFGRDTQDIKLIKNDGSARKYVTLSYCWGKSKTFVTTSRSLRHRMQRINFDSLPITFKDAVTIARHLDVRWMWIDALCIIQDDRADWERESVKMGAIYSMAYVTIAADAGADSNSGCFNIKSVSQDRTSGKSPFELVNTMEDGTESRIYLWDPTRTVQKAITPEIDASPLSERGWVCQERILSPRILHYTDTQLFWECRQFLKAEDNLQVSGDTVCGLARNLYGSTTDPIGRANLLSIWYNAVVSQSYSRRKLTNPEDKLTALSGIARAFGRHFRTTYLAGIWYQDLPWGLSWRRKGQFVQTSKLYRAPSFSWAAYDAPVEWPVHDFDQKSRVKVLSIDVTLRGADPFGQVASSSLLVEGYVYNASLTPHKNMTPSGVDLTWHLRGQRGEWGPAFVDEAPNDAIEVSLQAEYLILSHDDKTKHTRVLLLEKTDVENQYQRKGAAELLGFAMQDSEFFDEKSRKKLKLI